MHRWTNWVSALHGQYSYCHSPLERASLFDLPVHDVSPALFTESSSFFTRTTIRCARDDTPDLLELRCVHLTERYSALPIASLPHGALFQILRFVPSPNTTQLSTTGDDEHSTPDFFLLACMPLFSSITLQLQSLSSSLTLIIRFFSFSLVAW